MTNTANSMVMMSSAASSDTMSEISYSGTGTSGKLEDMLHLEGVKLHKHIEHFLHDFNQFKLLSSDGIKKCEHINNEKVKNGQTISLDKYNSGDFLNVINVLKICNSIRIHENSNLSKNLDTFFEKSDFIIRNHIKTLNIFNSRIQD